MVGNTNIMQIGSDVFGGIRNFGSSAGNSILSFGNNATRAVSNLGQQAGQQINNLGQAATDQFGRVINNAGNALGLNNIDINLSLPSIALQLAFDPKAVDSIISNAAALDASGGVSNVTANGVSTGVTASSQASALYDVTPVTVGTFNYASRALQAIDSVLKVIETNDVKAFEKIIAQASGSLGQVFGPIGQALGQAGQGLVNLSGQLFSQLQQNQALIRTALAQASIREGVRNENLGKAQETRKQRTEASAKLGEQPKAA